MTPYLEPIKTAIFVFPFLAVLLSLPFVVLQYRRYGSFLWSRTIVLFSFVFYMLCAYFLIVLPLPPIHVVAVLTTPHYNLVPFMFVREFIRYSGFELGDWHTWVYALKQPSFLQPAFNLALTVPFGFYMRYYFRRPWWQTILLTFGLSLFFELTQLSGLYFVYPRPYRLFDVDDLLINTSGGLVGFWLTPLIAIAFPSRNQMDARSYARADRVGPLRRFVAWFVDVVLINCLIGVALAALVGVMGDQQLGQNWVATYFVTTILMMYVVPLLTHGQTLGKQLLRIRIVDVHGGKLTWWRLGIRQGLLYLVTMPLVGVWALALGHLMVNVNARTQLNLLAVGLLSVFVLFVAWNFFWQLVRGRERLFYEAWAGTSQSALKPASPVDVATGDNTPNTPAAPDSAATNDSDDNAKHDEH